MLEAERHQMILKLLKEKEAVKLQELVDVTNASESTIRRDLTLLEQKKFLKRVHGGASRLQGKLFESHIEEKSTKNVHDKQLIARFAASLVEEGDSIYLDAGSTVFEMIPFLPTDIVVVSNGLNHIPELLNRGIKTFLIGGYCKPTTNALIGRGAMGGMKQYRFDKCFVGANGIHPQYGYTTPDHEEAMVKQQAVSLSREAYVLADVSKFSEVFFSEITELSKATIITTSLADNLQEQMEKLTNIKVVTE